MYLLVFSKSWVLYAQSLTVHYTNYNDRWWYTIWHGIDAKINALLKTFVLDFCNVAKFKILQLCPRNA